MDMNVSCTTLYPIGVADERGLPAVTLAKKKVIQIYGTHILRMTGNKISSKITSHITLQTDDQNSHSPNGDPSLLILVQTMALIFF